MANSTNRALLANYLLGQQASTLGKNYVKNSMALQSTNNVTASGTATVSRNTTTPLTAIADFSISLPNNATDYVEWSLDTLDNSMSGKNCEVRLDYTASSIGSNVVVQVLQGSNIAIQSSALGTTSTSRLVSLNVPCGDLSSATTIRIANGSGNSGTSSLKVANVTYGLATNLTSVAQPTLYGSIKYAAASSCTWSTTSSSWADFAAVSACSTPTVTDNAVAPSTKIPAIKFNFLPPGTYKVSAIGKVVANANGSTANSTGAWRFFDGTNASIVSFIGKSAVSNFNEALSYSPICGYFTYTTPQSNIIISLQAYAPNANASQYIDASSTTHPMDFAIYVERIPTSSEVVYRPELLSNMWFGAHGNDCAWSRSNTSYGDFTADSTCTFSEKVNVNFGTVVSATSGSDKLPGIVFTPSKIGTFLACVNFNIDGSAAAVQTVRLTTDGSTSIGEAQANDGNRHPATLCALINATSLSPITLKLQGKSSTGNVNLDVNAAADNNMTWSIVQISQSVPAPLLVGSVTTPSTGAELMVRANVDDACTSSPCTLAANVGFTNITRSSTGNYTANFSKAFSAAPTCVVTSTTSGLALIRVTATSTTTATLLVMDSSLNASDRGFALICMGPK